MAYVVNEPPLRLQAGGDTAGHVVEFAHEVGGLAAPLVAVASGAGGQVACREGGSGAQTPDRPCKVAGEEEADSRAGRRFDERQQRPPRPWEGAEQAWPGQQGGD